MSHAKNYINRPKFHGAIEKNKSDTLLWTTVLRVILFMHSSIASGNNNEYLTPVF